MNWTTIYITGRPGFKEEIEKQIKKSDLPHMPGFTQEENLALFWISEQTSLRQLKAAIGSKTLWKYRLHFHDSVETFVESQNKGKLSLTKEESDLVSHMYTVESRRNHQ